MSAMATKRAAPRPPPLAAAKKAPLAQNNGNIVQQPLTYNDGPSDDENMNEIEGRMDLIIVLPGGKETDINIDLGMPMMDLLVQAAASNKLNPGSHVIKVFNDDTGRPIDYKASQTVGSLGVNRIYLVPKKSGKDKKKATVPFEEGESGLGLNISGQFEVTVRLAVNLPGNKKFVTRVNPELPVAEIYKQVCTEKNLEIARYEVRLTSQPDKQLDLSTPFNKYNTNEINLISVKAPSFRKSASDLIMSQRTVSTMQPTSAPKSAPVTSEGDAYMPGGKEKKKKGLFSFMKKDKKSFKVSDTNYNFNQTSSPPPPLATSSPTSDKPDPNLNRRSMPPMTEESSTLPRPVLKKQPQSTSAVTQESTTLPRPAKSTSMSAINKKKRAAPPPPPPQSKTSTTSLQNSTSTGVSSPELVTPISTSKLHSRNSSDSSGYHELSPSSPTESPDFISREKTKMKTSLDTTSIESSELISPPAQSPRASMETLVNQNSLPGSTETLTRPGTEATPTKEADVSVSPTKLGAKGKKRRAPAPPPPGGAPKPPASPTKEASPRPTEPPPAPPTKDDGMGDVVLRNKPHSARPHTVILGDVDRIKPSKSKPRRPCSFIAPPPPESPPPEFNDSDYSLPMQDSSQITIEGFPVLQASKAIGTTPSIEHAREHSIPSSEHSITTMEDVDLCFGETIAVAEQAIERDEKDGYKNEMATFVEQMSAMTKDIHDGKVPEDDDYEPEEVSVQSPTESDKSSTGTFLHLSQSSDQSETSSGNKDEHIEDEQIDGKEPVKMVTLDNIMMEDTISQSEEAPEYVSSGTSSEVESETTTKEVEKKPEVSKSKSILKEIQASINNPQEDVKTEPEVKIEAEVKIEPEVEAEPEVVEKAEPVVEKVEPELVNSEPEKESIVMTSKDLEEVYKSPEKESKKGPTTKSKPEPVVDPKKETARQAAEIAASKPRAESDPGQGGASKKTPVVEYKAPWVGPKMGKSELIVPSKQKRRVVAKPKPVEEIQYSSLRDSIKQRSIQDVYGAQRPASIYRNEINYLDHIAQQNEKEEKEKEKKEQREEEGTANTEKQTTSEAVEAEDEYRPSTPLEEHEVLDIEVTAVPVHITHMDTESETDSVSKGSEDHHGDSPALDNSETVTKAEVEPDNSSQPQTEEEWIQEVERKLEQQRLLQAQYEQLQQQFGLWQQQLVQNQAILEEKKILNDSGTLQSQMFQHLEKMSILRESMESFADSMEANEQMTAPPSEPVTNGASTVSVETNPVAEPQQNGDVTPPHPAKVERSSSFLESMTPRGFGQTKVDRASSFTKVRNIKAELERSNSQNSDKEKPDFKKPPPTVAKPYSAPSAKTSVSMTAPSPPALPQEPVVTKTTANNVNAPPPPPPIANGGAVPKVQLKPASQRPPSKRFEPQLDPREELMIAIRSAGGRQNLRKVPVSETRWHHSF